MTALKDLKVGDTVVCCYGFTQKRLSKIQRVTKLHLVVATIKYRKDNGRPAGSDSYSQSYITIPTEQMVAEIRHSTAASRLENINWRPLPTETLEAILALVEKAKVTA